MTHSLVIADGHRVLREGLRVLLGQVPGLRVVGEAADGPSAVRSCEELRPDVLVLGLLLPGMSGLEVARRVTRLAPAPKVVVLTMYAEPATAAEAFRAGALAFIPKEAGIDEVTAGVRAALRGERFVGLPLTAAAVDAALARLPAADPFDRLTEREREVLRLTVEGATSADIAARLFLSPRTVESHRNNLMRKLGVRNQKELVRRALARQPVRPPLPDRTA